VNDHEPLSFSNSFLFAAGLLVGYGTMLANGCTSGHGVAGLSRFSPRSLVSVLTFLSFAMVTRYLLGLHVSLPTVVKMDQPYLLVIVLLMVPLGLILKWARINSALASTVISFYSGILFGSGLMLAGMTDYRKVLSFFPLDSWDPSMMIVMMSACIPNMILNLFADKFLKQPLFAKQMNISNRRDITHSLFIGSALFGVGWGMVGLCPGPALVNLFQVIHGDYRILYWMFGFYCSKLVPRPQQ
jgi:uncharacterized membrane protein YedE/YeeE